MAKYTVGDIFEGDAPVTQYFGNNPDYYKQISGGRLAGHEGVDWGLAVGRKLLSPFNQGIILRTGWDAMYGYYVVIWDRKQKCAVWHCHCSRIYVNPGQVVAMGELVALSGATGNVTGPHLHEDFVETDEYGNRLNTNNGYLGYRNILNNSLVAWILHSLGLTTPGERKVEKVKADVKEGTLTIDEVIEKDLVKTHPKKVFAPK
jgi:hypothetical protein